MEANKEILFMTTDVTGMIDMHIHSSPDIRPRSCNDLELAADAEKLNMRAIVIKSHIEPTMSRAWLAHQSHPNVEVFGGITLNKEVGGLNPYAVEAAIKMGAKIVWLPTAWSHNDRWVSKGLNDGIVVVDKQGEILPVLREILLLVRDACIVLGLGHQSWNEALAIVSEASKVGLKKVVVNHPEWPTMDYSLKQQAVLLAHGVWFERIYARRFSKQAPYTRNFSLNLKAIQSLGWKSTIISTDGGQTENPPWAQAYMDYIYFLRNSGLSEEAISSMTQKTPAYLLGLE